MRLDRGTQLTSLLRHGNHRPEKTRKGKDNYICRAHEESQQKLLDSEKSSGERGGVSPADELRQDVPTLPQFFFSLWTRIRQEVLVMTDLPFPFNALK